MEKLIGRMTDICRNFRDERVQMSDIQYVPAASIRVKNTGSLLTQWSLGQLCNRAGIPTRYFKKCPAELQSQQMDYWLRKVANEEVFLRHDGMRTRAILTDSYSAVENLDLVTALRGIVRNPVVKNVQVDDFGFRAMVLSNDHRFEVGDDVYYAGVQISNSEVGAMSLSIMLGLWCQWCANGAVTRMKDSGVSYVRRHYGRNFRIREEALRILCGLSDYANAAKLNLELLYEARVDADTKTQIYTEAKLTQADIIKIEGKSPITIYDIFSGITNIAQEYDTVSRHSLELYVGNRIFNPKGLIHV